MDRCIRCERDEEEVKLLDAVSDNEIVKICEECAVSEDIPLIRKPSSFQLKESERGYSVKERLRRMSGLKTEEDREVSNVIKKMSNVTLDDLRKPKTQVEKIQERYKLAKKRNMPVNLIDNFHWMICMARRKRKLSRKEVANAIGESETALSMIENKEIPDDSLPLINKLEQFFGIKLKKEMEEKEIHNLVSKKIIEQETEETKIQEEKEPARILKIDRDSVKNITIADLKRMKEEREKKEKRKLEEPGEDIEKLIWQASKEDKEREKKEWKKETDDELVGDDVEFE